MEAAFGHDFGLVRVHADDRAAQSATQVGALAYTFGHQIAFARGAYQPDSVTGRELLAHELAHVVQQSNVSGLPTGIAPANDPTEHEAHTAAGRVAAGKPAVAPELGHTLQQLASSAPGLQLKPGANCTSEWVCATGDGCSTPDVAPKANAKASDWTLKVMIDIEAETAADIGKNSIGHTYVEFSDSAGAIYTYGFYPNIKADITPDTLESCPFFDAWSIRTRRTNPASITRKSFR